MTQFIHHQNSRIAYRQLQFDGPHSCGVVFLGGFRSNMRGTKATLFSEWAAAERIDFTAFDYFAHGESTGDFAQGTLSRWISDAKVILEKVCQGPQVVIGSSMGGWVGARLLSLCPQKIAAFVGIAAAPDFTERLWQQELDDAARDEIDRTGAHTMESNYEEPYLITKALIEDGRKHCVLNQSIAFAKPVRLFHGISDPVVPWQSAIDLCKVISSDDVRINLIKDGDHSLSRPQDMQQMYTTLMQVMAHL